MKPLLSLLAGVLLLGCGGPPRPDLLVIVSDAFRADALSCAGGAPATPNLCRLAASGVTFERAYAAAPWTLPSVVAMVTGNAPSQYHLTTEDQAIAPELRDRVYRIPEGELPLGELLLAAGYRVEARVENPVVMRAGALRRFTRLEDRRARNERLAAGLDPRLGFRPRDERYLGMAEALALLSEPAEAPLAFLYWIDDPHAEYRPPRELLEPSARCGRSATSTERCPPCGAFQGMHTYVSTVHGGKRSGGPGEGGEMNAMRRVSIRPTRARCAGLLALARRELRPGRALNRHAATAPRRPGQLRRGGTPSRSAGAGRLGRRRRGGGR